MRWFRIVDVSYPTTSIYNEVSTDIIAKPKSGFGTLDNPYKRLVVNSSAVQTRNQIACVSTEENTITSVWKTLIEIESPSQNTSEDWGACYIGSPLNVDLVSELSNNDYITIIEEDSYTISGKYKIKDNVSPTLNNFYIPINYTINGQQYNFIGNTSYKITQNTTYKTCFGKYNNEETVTDYITVTQSEDSSTVSTELLGAVFYFDDDIEIPSSLYYWIENNFDKLYDNNYYIKDNLGNVTYGYINSPTPSKILLTQEEDVKTLTITDVDGNTYQKSWQSVVPEGYVFIGLSYIPNRLYPDIQLNVETSFSLEGEISLYEVYVESTPTDDNFIQLFRYNSEANRVDKTNYMERAYNDRGYFIIPYTFRNECSIIRPNITITLNTSDKFIRKVIDFNYVYIPDLNRYYFVENYIYLTNNLVEINLRIDVLMTYRVGINQLDAFIDRNEFTYNPRIIDPKQVVMVGYTTKTIEVETEIFSPYATATIESGSIVIPLPPVTITLSGNGLSLSPND